MADLFNTLLGLTFQQVQKYERGSNRISASKLYEIAKTLKVTISYFFDGFEGSEVTDEFNESRSEQAVHGFLSTSEGIELAQSFPRITNARKRRKLVELVHAMVED